MWVLTIPASFVGLDTSVADVATIAVAASVGPAEDDVTPPAPPLNSSVPGEGRALCAGRRGNGNKVIIAPSPPLKFPLPGEEPDDILDFVGLVGGPAIATPATFG